MKEAQAQVAREKISLAEKAIRWTLDQYKGHETPEPLSALFTALSYLEEARTVITPRDLGRR